MLIIIGVFSILTPMAYGFTIDGLTNFQGPGGGNVTFASQYVVSRLDIINAFYRFTNTAFGGVATGTTGFDCDTGDTMSLTNIEATTLSYTISGAGQQRVYFQGYGRPNTITGGTVVVGAGNSLVVTTTGAGVVTMSWDTKLNVLVNNITGYLVLVGLVPLILAAAMVILAVQTGTFNQKTMGFIVSLTISIYVTILVWLSMTKA